MITSHETAVDFKYFYNSLNKVSADFKINFVYKPERIVSDACEAMHKALTKFESFIITKKVHIIGLVT